MDLQFDPLRADEAKGSERSSKIRRTSIPRDNHENRVPQGQGKVVFTLVPKIKAGKARLDDDVRNRFGYRAADEVACTTLA